MGNCDLLHLCFHALDQSYLSNALLFGIEDVSAGVTYSSWKISQDLCITLLVKCQRSANLMQQAKRDLARQELYESMQALVWGTELEDDFLQEITMALN